MFWAMFCWETLGPAIHVDVTLTRTTYLSIAADHVHHFMEVVPNWSPITGLKGSAANILVPDATCLDGSGLFWQQKGDQQNIRKVVIMCLISVYM